MNLSKALVVAAREYSAAVRSKSFLIALILMPIWLSGGFLAQKLTQNAKDTSTYRVAIIDRTPGAALYPAIAHAVDHHNKVDAINSAGQQLYARFYLEKIDPAPQHDSAAVARQRMQLSNQVRAGALLGFVEIGKSVLATGVNSFGDDGIIRYSSGRITSNDFASLLRAAIPSAVYEHRFAGTGISSQQLRQMLAAPPVVESGLVQSGGGGVGSKFQSAAQRTVPLFVGVAMVMLMFMVTMLGTSPMIGNVIEEKQLRIAEVLLGGVRPFDLMLGKLLGGCGVSLTLAAIFFAGGYAVAYRFGVTDELTGANIGWFAFFLVMTTLLYGSIFTAAGSACTNIKEAQAFIAPVMLLIALPLFFLGPILQNASSGMAIALSMFPLSAPIAMLLRVTLPPGVPIWQPITSGAIVLLTTLLCMWAAGRIFRIGFLMQGKGANYATVAKWILRG